MKPAGLIVVLALALMLSGWGWVRSKIPAGDTPATLDPQYWEGSWIALRTPGVVAKSLSANSAVLIQVTAPNDGVMKATWIAPNSRLRSVDVFLRDLERDGSTTSGVLSVQAREFDDEPAQEGYYFGYFQRDGDLVLLWLPNRGGFGELVKRGKLQGTMIDTDKLVLDSVSSPKNLDVEDGLIWSLFWWSQPLVFWKAGHVGVNP
jgi:hypothetical protein